MVLNFITLNILPFLPGRDWKKKGFPWFAIYKNNVTIKKTGSNIIKAIKAAEKSKTGLISAQYILENIFHN
jgi:hypothetical protein